MKIIECVPNVSEGRDTAIIDALANTIRQTPGCTLLDIESDPNHNRSVFTFIGDPASTGSAVVALCERATALIDLTRHQGEHPRIGAVDVIPFIPIRDATLAECVALSKEVGRIIAEHTGVPVFLYEQSASTPHRQNLAAIRKGQFEGLADKLAQPEWVPDYGEARPHPTAGAFVIGARTPLIAFNINLNTDKLPVAKAIAKIIRESSGGLTCVKALGIMLTDRNIAQVSINMTDFTRTPLYRVVELVKAEAARYGVSVIGTEIIGLSPAKALIDSAAYYLMIEGFHDQMILENHLP